MIRGLLIGLVALGVAGCKDDKALGTEVPEGSRGDGSAREQCVASGGEVQSTDVNNDGAPDIHHVVVDGRRKCTEIDLNYDGRTDIVRFYDGDGETPVREEHDFDFDGKLDQIAFFEAGDLVRKELDTNFDSRIDTWLWCEGGRVKRAERDRRNTGEADTWEVYEKGVLTQAAYDENNDGQPEKWEMFDAGRLAEIRYDTDYDGEADRKEQVSSDEAGPAVEPLTCEVGDLGQRTAGGEAPAGDDEAEDRPGEDDDDEAEEPQRELPGIDDAGSVTDAGGDE
ncbi:MAG: hypothetical protein ACODAU_12005 [Myxococcota bacterium]